MTKFLHAKSLLFAFLVVFLWSGRVLADDPLPLLPPLPAPGANPSPPELDTLPPPPQLQWQSLGPKDPDDPSSGVETVGVPPPKVEASIAPPPPPVVENPVLDAPDSAQVELVKPDVEIWRGESEWPQIPPRSFNKLELAYMTGTEPVWLRVQFDPAAAGKLVSARPGPGLTLDPPNGLLSISSSGECLVLAQLHEGIDQSHILFFCEGIKTVLPISRASLSTVIAAEEETGGGR